MKHKSFTLIEAVVTIAIILLLAVAFTPGLARRQQQVELDRASQMIINGIYETRSLAISPTKVAPDTGKVMQGWIMIMNMHPTLPQPYCYAVNESDMTCKGGTIHGYNVPPHSFVIFAAEDTNPTKTRFRIKEVTLPPNISIFYDFPCHHNLQDNPDIPGYPGIDTTCLPIAPGAVEESYLWKVTFRHLDGAIGYGGKYYNNPDDLGGYNVGFWGPGMWGNSCDSYVEGSPNCPKYSKIVIVGGILDPLMRFDTDRCVNGLFDNLKCKIITVDNVTGSINVGT